MDPTVLAALISTVGVIANTLLLAVLHWRVSNVQANVQKVETATNSMQDKLLAATRSESYAAGAKAQRNTPDAL